ncbi:MAG TPA: thioredoxin domain-containing protein [Candidatus Bathyarchaeia archaeon]|nr:thioredoxin domain-containing protein [Candidatus Bathyarchaeia archaeon]
MKKLVRKILVTVLVVVLGIAAIVWARLLFFQQDQGPLTPRALRSRGNPGAPVQIIEYFDFRCGPCANGARWIKDVLQKYPGKIYLEVRHFPLHLSNGALEARFTECARAQGKFWEIHDRLMASQKKWIKEVNPEASFLQMARESGLDETKLTACWADPDLYDSIIAMKDEGARLGVNATPSYFVNGKMVVGVKNLESALLEALGESLPDDAKGSVEDAKKSKEGAHEK